MKPAGLLTLSALGYITVRTYNNNVLQESAVGSGLVALAVNGTDYEVGFYTDQPFDEIELEIGSSIGVGTYDVYYAVMRGTGSCSSPALVCNKSNLLAFPTFGAVVNPATTGSSGIALSALTSSENIVDNDPSSYATITTAASVLGTVYVGVKDVVTTYPAGTYASFDIENSALLSANLIGNVTVRTYLNGTFRQQASGADLLLGASLLNGTGRQRVGFVTSQTFDEVQLVINQPVSVDLGVTRVYGAVLKEFCAGPALACNTPARLADTTHPVYIQGNRTGITGVACANCDVQATGAVIDGDSTTYATIDLLAGGLTGGHLSVKNEITDYPAGTYAGFEVQNLALLDVDALAAMVISTYKDGALQQSVGGASLLVGVGTNLLFGSNGRTTLGFVTSQDFDEVRISAVNTATVNLGITRVYDLVLTNFCAGTIACNSTYYLNSGAYPVYVNARRTGVTGLVCALCNVSDAGNVVSSSNTDYAQLTTVAAVAASSSISVHDAVSTYPVGTIAGFTVRDPNNLLQVALFERLTIRTYNNGALQEVRSGGQLLDLAAIIPLINAGTGRYNIGFQTSLPFDEVQISATSLAGVIPTLEVYGAFVNTNYLDSLSASVACPKPPIAEPDHVGTIVNMAVSGNMRTNDRDPRGSALTYNTTPLTAPTAGAVTVNTNGTFTYTPNNNYTGADSFRYQVCNAGALCDSAWVHIWVMPVRTPGGANRPPVALTDYNTTMVNVAVSGTARNNDSDPDGDAITYSVVEDVRRGTLTVNPATGAYTYTPDSSFVGKDTAMLRICDNGTPSMCDSSMLIIDVVPDMNGPANDPPNAFDDVYTTSAKTMVSGWVIANDSDPNGDPLVVTVLDPVPASTGTLYAAPDGGFTFVPDTAYTGTFSVRYKICDNGTPNLCDTATLTITVQPVVGPDFTPVITLDSLNFETVDGPRDFVLTVKEVLGNSASNGSVVVRILKPTGFNITFSGTTTSVAVGGSTAVQNSNWTITQNSAIITCTLNAGQSISAGGESNVGFTIARRPGVPANTYQNLTATISRGTGGDSNSSNNQNTVNLLAK